MPNIARSPTGAVDPTGLARSLPGVADVGGPALVAEMGDPSPVRSR